MRSALNKQLKSQFKRSFEAQYPYFSQVKTNRRFPYPTWILTIDRLLTFYVMILPFNNKDQFAIEIGWSNDSDSPWSDYTSFDVSLLKCRRRLSRLWATSKSEPVWTITPEPTEEEYKERRAARKRGEKVSLFPPVPPEESVLPRIAPLVNDAIDKITEYAIPLFRRVAEYRGLTFPLPAVEGADVIAPIGIE